MKIGKNSPVLLLLASLLAGCATGGTAHHHHNPEYGGRCAYSVAHGRHDVTGNDEISVTYRDKTYFFSTEDAKGHFLSEIKSNVDAANRQWRERPSNVAR